jgi:hypothetical protein
MVQRCDAGASLLACLLGGLAMCAVGSASAGFLFTESTVNDFADNGMKMWYDEEARGPVASGGSLFPLIDSVPHAPGTDRLYLTGEAADGGEPPLSPSFDSGAERAAPDGAGTVQHKLAGVIEAVTPLDGNGGEGLELLVTGDEVSGSLSNKYTGSGIYVTVAGLAGTEWLSMYRSLSNPLLAQDTAASAVPGLASATPKAASLPGTLPLMLMALVISLFARKGRV